MKKSTKFLPYALFYIFIAFLILVSNVNQIPSDAELAGIIIYLNAIFITVVILLVTLGFLLLSTQFFSNRNYQFIINTFIILFGLFTTNRETKNICTFENQDYSVYSIISKQKEDMTKTIDAGKDILQKSDNVKVNRAIIRKDSTIIINYINNFLDSCIMPVMPKEKQIIKSKFINFFHLILSDSTTSKVDSILISSIKKSISLDYIAYSPDEKFIVTMLTYNYSENRVGILFLLGESSNSSLNLYKRDCNFEGDIFINQEYAFYKFFTDIRSRYKDYKCSCDLSSKNFWECSNFEKIFIMSNYVNRFKIVNKYDNQLKVYKDTLATSFIISKTK